MSWPCGVDLPAVVPPISIPRGFRLASLGRSPTKHHLRDATKYVTSSDQYGPGTSNGCEKGSRHYELRMGRVIL